MALRPASPWSNFRVHSSAAEVGQLLPYQSPIPPSDPALSIFHLLTSATVDLDFPQVQARPDART